MAAATTFFVPTLLQRKAHSHIRQPKRRGLFDCRPWRLRRRAVFLSRRNSKSVWRPTGRPGARKSRWLPSTKPAYEDLVGRDGFVRTRPLRSKERGTHDCYVKDTMVRTANMRVAAGIGASMWHHEQAQPGTVGNMFTDEDRELLLAANSTDSRGRDVLRVSPAF